MEDLEKIKVTVITGFFGAGKTTFINNLLIKYPETRFALVENEFGDISIDTKLIRGIDASSMFELRNGCICCKIADEYELVLHELAQRFPETQHLLIETTGVADPGPVIRPFIFNKFLKGIYQYNGTICIVDAQNINKQPDTDIWLKQISIADLILVNKTENILPGAIEVIHQLITHNNPLCRIVNTIYGGTAETNLNSGLIKNKLPDRLPVFSGKSLHTSLEAKIIEIREPPEKAAFMDQLAYNFEIHRDSIFRIKGFIYFKDDPYEYVIQGVGGSLELVETGIAVGDRLTRLVFIHRMNPGHLMKELFPNSHNQ